VVGSHHDASGFPSALHGGRTCAPIEPRASSIIRSDRFIATGFSPPTPEEWIVEPVEQEQQYGQDGDDRLINMPWTTARSPRSAKNNMKTKTTRDEEQRDPERRGDHAGGPWTIAARLFPRRRLIEPLVVADWLPLSAAARLQRAKHPTLHGLIAFRVPARMRSHSPFTTDRP
jgi:hypothetical protein